MAAGLAAGLRQMGVRRSALTLLRVNQADGFDCPGLRLARAGAGHRSHAEFCENGAKAVAEEATLRRITRGVLRRSTRSASWPRRSDHWLGQQGRLTEPMVERAGRRPLRADRRGTTAFALIADAAARPGQPGRGDLLHVRAGPPTRRRFCWQLLARAYGTNNLPDCSNMCHESSGLALTQTIGVGKGSVTLDDIHAAKLLVVVGQNPGTNHPAHAHRAGDGPSATAPRSSR